VQCAHLVNTFPRSIAFTRRDAADKEDDRRRHQQRHDDKRCDGKRRLVEAVVPPEPIAWHAAQPPAMVWGRLDLLVMVSIGVHSASSDCTAGRTRSSSWTHRRCGSGTAALLHNSVCYKSFFTRIDPSSCGCVEHAQRLPAFNFADRKHGFRTHVTLSNRLCNLTLSLQTLPFPSHSKFTTESKHNFWSLFKYAAGILNYKRGW
jgi:hypothetical protein